MVESNVFDGSETRSTMTVPCSPISHWPSLRRIWSVLVLSILLFTAACATTRTIPATVDAEGNRVEIRRAPLRANLDYIHRFRAKAYDTPGWFDLHFLSKAQESIIAERGRPDYVRSYRSTDHEPIVEWLYLEQNVLSQFCRGRQVFEGPVTDLERVLLRLGYPRYAITKTEEMGPELTTFLYRTIGGSRFREYTFSDGRLVSKSE